MIDFVWREEMSESFGKVKRPDIHSMSFLIGWHEIDAKVAIAENDKVPNVLGRKDVFNLF